MTRRGMTEIGLDDLTPSIEPLEARLLLAAYEVWGGFTNFTSEGGPPDWPSYLYSIDQQEGYVKLGEADGTETFVGNYRYYVIVANENLLVDAVQTSDGNYLGHNGQARLSGGNVTEWMNLLGAPDGNLAFFNGAADSHGTYGAFVAFPNFTMDTWDSWTGLRVVVEQPTSMSPDLVAGVEAVQSGIYRPGQTLPVAVWYQNIGFGAVNQSFGLSLYLSHDRVFDANDTIVFRSIEEGGLDVWDRVPVTGGINVNARIPANTPSGRYYLLVVADDTNAIQGELNEDNNVWISTAAVVLIGSENDFSGDGKADIVWRNGATGENVIWFMDGTRMMGGTHLPTLTDQSWQMRGAGDFNGDGQSDLVWRNVVTGQNVVWFMGNGVNIGGVNLPAQVDLNWDIVAIADFNGDGPDDILWRNNSTGENLAWLMSNSVIGAPAGVMAEANLDWRIVGAGDFDNNGMQDILWRNSATGAMRVWRMAGTMFSSSVALPSEPDLTWQTAGIGDYNGDGTPDILWRNEVSGQNRVWLMVGESLAQTVEVYPLGDLNWRTIWQQDWSPRAQVSLNGSVMASGQLVNFGSLHLGSDARQNTFTIQNVGNSDLSLSGLSVPSGFDVIQPLPANLAPGQTVNLTVRMNALTPGLRAGQVTFNTNDPSVGAFIMPVSGMITQCADFTNDGMPDLLWRNTVTGENAIWFMSGTNVSGGTRFTTLNDTNWIIVGSADFNADGFNDVVWRNTATGQNVVWFMQGGTNIGGVELLAQQDLTWDIVAVQDINGDGPHDLLWRNRVTGENLAWLMSGAVLAAPLGIRAETDLTWRIVGMGDFDRSGSVDILWRNNTSGENRIWLMQDGLYVATLNIQQEPDQNWQVGLVSDFNGDGIADIFWRNEVSGQHRIWLMAGGIVAQVVDTTALSDVDWRLPQQRRLLPQLLVEQNGAALPSGTFSTLATAQVGDPVNRSTFTITNVGEEVMTLGQVTVPDGMTVIQNLPATLQPGQSAQLIIETGTTIPGSINGQISFANNDPRVGVFTLNIDGLVTGRCDFSGDGLGDIIWRNTATGENVIWFMAGTNNVGGVTLATLADQSWRIVGSGDFNNDGFCDLVWRNIATGSVDVWFMANGANIGGANLQSWPDLNWRIVGVADLNDDGQDDLLWRNAVTGENFAWLMSGTTLAAPAGILADPDVSWEIVGTADFNMNGQTDILWRNNTTGEIRVWYMNRTTFEAVAALPTENDLQWRIAALDDFNQDGWSDILWRNSVTGENRVWLMSQTNIAQVVNLPTLSDLNWTIGGNLNAA